MPRVEIPLIGPSYTNREKPLSMQSAVNMWPEINPEARNQVALHNTAGIRIFAELEGTDRGMHDFNNLLYAVNGTTLYSIDETGAHIALGTIPGKSRVQMASDSNQLIIVTGETPYRYTVSGGLEAITDPDLVEPTCVAYINSQFVFDNNNGVWGEFVTSSIEAGLAVDALDFATAESHPDDITAIVAYRQLVYFFGSHSIELWSNTGTGNPPFARASSGVRPFGVAGRDAVLTTTEYIYFLDHQRIPRRSNGLDFPSIGTPALGVEFSKYTRIDDCIAMQFVQDGQQFVAFTFPTADKTWCFHEPSGSWFELQYIKTGAMNQPAEIITPPSVPEYIGPDIANFAAENGVAITPIAAAAKFTGTDLVFTLGGTWPSGISIHATTGAITGTPSDAVATYTGLYVIATNINGTDSSTTFEIALAASAYDPGMMTFAGGRYELSNAGLTGQNMTVVMRFNVADFAAAAQQPFLVQLDSYKLVVLIRPNDYATAESRRKLAFVVYNNAAAACCILVTTSVVSDGADHVAFCSYNGTTGGGKLYIDGVDEDDVTNPERVLTTGTLSTSESKLTIGGDHTGGSLYAGEAGYIGVSGTYLTNPTDFYHPTNGLQELDETGWTEWGSQPLFWNQYGTMTTNAGSKGNMTKIGTINGPA